MTLFEEIKLALNQAIEYENGNLEAATRILEDEINILTKNQPHTQP